MAIQNGVERFVYAGLILSLPLTTERIALVYRRQAARDLSFNSRNARWSVAMRTRSAWAKVYSVSSTRQYEKILCAHLRSWVERAESL